MKSYLFFIIHSTPKNKFLGAPSPPSPVPGTWAKTLEVNQLEIRSEVNNYLVLVTKYKILRLNHENQRVVQTVWRKRRGSNFFFSFSPEFQTCPYQ